MHWFRLFLLTAAMLTLLTACGSSDTPTPEPEAAPAPSEPAPAPAAQEPATPSMSKMQPCKIQNVEDSACTNELSKALSDILVNQGEGEGAATQAGQAIAGAIQNAPVDKRNGFTMTGPDTGKRYSFLFQNQDGQTYLVLFSKAEGADDSAYEIVTTRPMPSCICQP